MIGKLTWRNLWRNRRRTLITMASVTFAVVLAIVMKSLQNGVFDNLVKNIVSFYSGYIQVHKAGYQDEQLLENSFSNPDSISRQIRQPSVTALVPRLESFALASSGNTTKGCMVVGTDPQKENLLTSLENKLKQGTYLTPDQPAALLAEGLAKRLKLSVNDTIVLLGQGYQGSIAAGKFPVRGIIHFAQPQLNESLVYLPLKVAQEYLSAEDVVTSLALGIKMPADLSTIQQEIESSLGNSFEVLTWQQMLPGIESHMRADAAGFYVSTGILYLIISFGIFGTLLMMIAERKYEFGMLIAIGMKKWKLGRMLVLETLLISICGTAAGLLISAPIVWYLEKYPIRFSRKLARAYEQFGFEPVFPAILQFRVFLTQASIVMLIALIIGLYPLWHIRRLDPVSAMRK